MICDEPLASRDRIDDIKLPKDFIWATATAATQIEGGWKQDGKGESVWDQFSHQNPSPIKDGS